MTGQDQIFVSGSTGTTLIPFSKDDIIVTDDNVYSLELLYMVTPENVQMGVAYIQDDIFYTYKGELGKSDKIYYEPGIYKDGDKLVIKHPQTVEERKAMEYAEYIVVNDMLSAAAMVAADLDKIEYDNGDCGRVFAPPVEMRDDILKRAIKMCLLAKNVDIDSRRDRFPDKNALFNAKQVIKGDQKLSAMLFDRWCEALGVNYEIKLYEAGDKPVGNKLAEPIIVSNIDAF